ncbi:MAG: SRPBCC family protein [Betaproteobacteria bacterium]|nr:SRPBCC family protein [Betaproteobacteria bacterium]MDH5352417.1 SRPBCC family protein [Betaproteobacteria bacterium]
MNAPAILIKPSTVRLERLLPGPVERVWAYLTESKKRATWLAGGEFDLRVGGKIELVFENDKLSEESRNFGTKHFEGRITRLEPMRLLAHSWDWDGKDSEVVYELAPKGKDVLLTIVHRLPEDFAALRGVGGGWATHVGILEDVLKGAKPRPFWSTHDREMKAFEAAL